MISEPDDQQEADKQEDKGAVLLRQYVLRPPIGWDDDCEQEMRLQVALWNRLVEIERAHRAAFIACTADVPAVQAAETALQAVLEGLDSFKKERARQRSHQRKKDGTAVLDEEIRQAREKVKRLSGIAKEARREAREQLKPRLKELDTARFAAVKNARNDSGLWWGNYNAVCASYERARKAVLARGGELRFRRYDGEGRITNQIQGGMTVAKLTAGAHSQVRLLEVRGDEFAIRGDGNPRRADGKVPPLGQRRPGGNRDRCSRLILEATIFTRDGERKHVRWPVIIGPDRMLPDDAIVKEVVIHRRKVAHNVRWTVTFTCRQPQKAPVVTGRHVVAVDLSWRRLNDGLRVATLMDAAGHGFVVLPEKFIEGHDWLDEQQAQRDHVHDAAVKSLRDLQWTTAPPTLAAIAQWWRAIPFKSLVPRHTVRLVLAWREHAQTWESEAFAAAEQWRKHDKRIWTRTEHRSRRLTRERLDFYRKEAKRIVSDAKVVILEDFNLSRMATKTDDASLNKVNEAIQRNRTIAGVSVLRNWIGLEAEKVGAAIHVHSGVSTWLCSQCGHRLQPRNPAELIQQCPHCSLHVFDQDLEACRNMLAAYAASADVAEK